jgi:predicted small metal-binding protein
MEIIYREYVCKFYPKCEFTVCAKTDEEVIELVRMHHEIAHGAKESSADVGKKIKEHIRVAPIKPTGDPRVAKKKSLLDTCV